ncbi:MAG: mycothiol conjugate amidase Mca [Acidimicrobiia bacterium]|nr:mycothiol conjugate amidase Mca [Acidimicrobiia bacterium]
MSRTLVALHAHPDDESSKGAGTVAHYADEGVRCVLVTATGGEAGDILNPAMNRPEVAENLAEIRAEELAAAAEIIGYDEVIMLGYRDSGMPDTEPNAHPEAFVNAPFDEALERVVTIVRRERPEVVLGYDEHVRYPHPDHVRIHDLSLAAFEAAADPERFPESGEPWEIPSLFAPVFTVRRIETLHTAMLGLGHESPFEQWIERLDGATDTDKNLVHIDVTATLGRAREALRAHRTQVDPDGFWFQVPLDVVAAHYPFEDFELMQSRVDVASTDDLFSGI